jgi:hypothetical protein
MNYHDNLVSQADSAGDLDSVQLTLPKGMVLSQNLKAYVILDVFPINQELLK